MEEPRPAAATRWPGAGRGACLVLMGDPVPVRVAGPRTVVRNCPSTRIPLPSHAAAAACLSTSGPPAFRHPPRRALSVFPDTTGIAPSPARHVAPRPGSRHAGSCPAGAGSLPRLGGPPGRRGTPPSARDREYGVRCLAMRRRPSTAAALQRGTRSALSVLPSRRALRPGNVACGDSDCGAPYHRVITRASTILLARPLARLAARPILGPVTTAAAPPDDRPRKASSAASGRRSGSDGLAPQTAPAETGPNSRGSP